MTLRNLLDRLGLKAASPRPLDLGLLESEELDRLWEDAINRSDTELAKAIREEIRARWRFMSKKVII